MSAKNRMQSTTPIGLPKHKKTVKMAGRPNSSGPGSSSSSSAELPAVQGLNKMGQLPEEWTLPHEWKMEKREPFDNWKTDVQSQIANISRNLSSSLAVYPHPEVGNTLRSAEETIADWEAENQRLIYLQRQRSALAS